MIRIDLRKNTETLSTIKDTRTRHTEPLKIFEELSEKTSWIDFLTQRHSFVLCPWKIL